MSNAERCVACGAIIPEGRQLCYRCSVAMSPSDFANIVFEPESTNDE